MSQDCDGKLVRWHSTEIKGVFENMLKLQAEVSQKVFMGEISKEDPIVDMLEKEEDLESMRDYCVELSENDAEETRKRTYNL